MLEIESIIAAMRSHPHCKVSPPAGLPIVPPGISLPEDLTRFYELAGSAVINEHHKCACPTRILRPNEFERVDQAINGQLFASGPFENWFAVADVGDGNYVSIDLHPDNFGLCYDSFHETFAMPGYVSVIANSFTDFLSRLLKHTEDSTYWLQGELGLGEAFERYGFKSISPSL